MPTYAVRAPLARWLGAQAERASEDFGRYRLLDVGCGEKPYAALFAPYVSEHVGLDTAPHAHADLVGPIESIPAEDGAFDVVLCVQVLEHVDDPAQGVRELHRVTRPGGRVLLSTHGAMVYHPNPNDLWRWTHEGLGRLFAESGDWGSVTVTSGAGTASSLAMLNAIYLEHVLRRSPLRPVRGARGAAINRLARAIDGRSSILREPRPGTLAANYHVVAEKPRVRTPAARETKGA
jgi:SAM-dependent methyltransferase